MQALLKVLKTIASGIGTVLGAWVSVTLLALGKLTSLVTRLKKPVRRES